MSYLMLTWWHKTAHLCGNKKLVKCVTSNLFNLQHYMPWRNVLELFLFIQTFMLTLQFGSLVNILLIVLIVLLSTLLSKFSNILVHSRTWTGWASNLYLKLKVQIISYQVLFLSEIWCQINSVRDVSFYWNMYYVILFPEVVFHICMKRIGNVAENIDEILPIMPLQTYGCKMSGFYCLLRFVIHKNASENAFPIYLSCRSTCSILIALEVNNPFPLASGL